MRKIVEYTITRTGMKGCDTCGQIIEKGEKHFVHFVPDREDNDPYREHVMCRNAVAILIDKGYLDVDDDGVDAIENAIEEYFQEVTTKEMLEIIVKRENKEER